MAGKRAPGGGRKPKGDFAGKSSAFSTRITPELRAALDSESEQTGKSISQIVERRLRESYDEPKRMQRSLGPDHVRALAYIVAHLAQKVEDQTRQAWHQDRFTFDALGVAILAAMSRYRAEGEPVVPPAIEDFIRETAVRLRKPELVVRMEYLRHPEGIGISGASSLREHPNVTPPLGDTYEYPDEFYLIPFIHKALSKEKGPNGEWLGETEDGGRSFGHYPPDHLTDDQKRGWYERHYGRAISDDDFVALRQARRTEEAQRKR